MTNPSPRNAKERAAHREAHNANTFYRQAILDTNNVPGRFAKEEASTIVGAGAKYPAASGPWNDPSAQVLNSAPDVTGYDINEAPTLGEPFEQERAAQALADLRSEFDGVSDDDLRSEHARLTSPSGPIVGAPKWDAAVQALDNRRIAIEGEIRRRHEAVRRVPRYEQSASICLSNTQDDYKAMTYQQLAFEFAKVDGEMRRQIEWTPALDEMQARRDALEREMLRKRPRRF